MCSSDLMCPILHFLLLCIRCNISNATVVLSVISLSGIKALWASNIILGKKDFTRFASTLDIIRDTTLPKLMGRNSVIFCGSFFFWYEYNVCVIHFLQIFSGV